MKKMTQEQRVLRHLQEYGTITSFEAFREYGITRLSAVIYLLRKRGHNITSTNTKCVNRYDEITYFSTYKLDD